MVVRFALSLFLTHLAHECRTVHPPVVQEDGHTLVQIGFFPRKERIMLHDTDHAMCKGCAIDNTFNNAD